MLLLSHVNIAGENNSEQSIYMRVFHTIAVYCDAGGLCHWHKAQLSGKGGEGLCLFLFRLLRDESAMRLGKVHSPEI